MHCRNTLEVLGAANIMGVCAWPWEIEMVVYLQCTIVIAVKEKGLGIFFGIYSIHTYNINISLLLKR